MGHFINLIRNLILPFFGMVSVLVLIFTDLKEAAVSYSLISCISIFLLIPLYWIYKKKLKKNRRNIEYLIKNKKNRNTSEYLRRFNKVKNDTEEIIKLGSYQALYCPKCNMPIPTTFKIKWMIFIILLVLLAILFPIVLLLLFFYLMQLLPFIHNFTIFILIGCPVLLIYLLGKIEDHILLNGYRYAKKKKCPICDCKQNKT